MFIEKLGGEDKENASRDLNEIETYVTDKSAWNAPFDESNVAPCDLIEITVGNNHKAYEVSLACACAVMLAAN